MPAWRRTKHERIVLRAPTLFSGRGKVRRAAYKSGVHMVGKKSSASWSGPSNLVNKEKSVAPCSPDTIGPQGQSGQACSDTAVSPYMTEFGRMDENGTEMDMPITPGSDGFDQQDISEPQTIPVAVHSPAKTPQVSRSPSPAIFDGELHEGPPGQQHEDESRINP